MTMKYTDLTAGQLAIENVFTTYNWLNNEISKSLSPVGLTFAQYKILCLLSDALPAMLTCSQIGEMLADRTPDVTRLLDRLERNEWIERKRAEHDRRIVEVHLSAKGTEILNEARSPFERTITDVSNALANAEHLLLVDYLERLRRDTFR